MSEANGSLGAGAADAGAAGVATAAAKQPPVPRAPLLVAPGGAAPNGFVDPPIPPGGAPHWTAPPAGDALTACWYALAAENGLAAPLNALQHAGAGVSEPEELVRRAAAARLRHALRRGRKPSRRREGHATRWRRRRAGRRRAGRRSRRPTPTRARRAPRRRRAGPRCRAPRRRRAGPRCRRQTCAALPRAASPPRPARRGCSRSSPASSPRAPLHSCMHASSSRCSLTRRDCALESARDVVSSSRRRPLSATWNFSSSFLSSASTCRIAL